MASAEGGGKIVRDVMTTELQTLERNDQLTIADDVMQLERVRHMPVLDEDGALTGVVSQRDLFRGALARVLGYGTSAQRRVLKTIPIKEVMTTDPETIDADATLAEAGARMLEKKIGCLVVVEEGKLAGILTGADFVRQVVASEGS